MAKTIEKTGKTVEDAIQAALSELGVSESEVDVEVLETPSKGIFGFFGTKPARIKVTVKEVPAPDEIQKPAEKVPEDVGEPPTTVNFRVVPNLDNLPKVDEEFVEEDKISETDKKSEVDDAQIDNVENIASVESESVKEEVTLNREQIIDKAKKFLTDVFNAIHADVTINVREDDGNIILDLSDKDSALLIGKRGQTIDALQYLTNLAANRSSQEKIRFILDVENYRERREETIIKLAKSIADRVVRIRQDIKMEPMSRHERRLVHTTLQDNKRVETHSHGEDPYRYVVVSLKRKGK